MVSSRTLATQFSHFSEKKEPSIVRPIIVNSLNSEAINWFCIIIPN